MKTINKAYLLMLYPTEKQEIIIAKTIGCSRFACNYFLNRRTEYHRETEKSIGHTRYSEELTNRRRQKPGWQQEARTATWALLALTYCEKLPEKLTMRR